MPKGVAIGIVLVLVLLAVVVFASSAHVQKLKAEGQFGTPVVTD